MLGFKSFYAAQKTLARIELVNMIKKGQMEVAESGPTVRWREDPNKA
jgi:hypothetical protein